MPNRMGTPTLHQKRQIHMVSDAMQPVKTHYELEDAGKDACDSRRYKLET